MGAELDPVTDLKEADLLTYNYIKKIEMVRYHENQKCVFLPIVITITFKVLHDNMLMFISKFSQIIASMNMYIVHVQYLKFFWNLRFFYLELFYWAVNKVYTYKC